METLEGEVMKVGLLSEGGCVQKRRIRGPCGGRLNYSNYKGSGQITLQWIPSNFMNRDSKSWSPPLLWNSHGLDIITLGAPPTNVWLVNS